MEWGAFPSKHLRCKIVVVPLHGLEVLGAVFVQRGLDRGVAQDLGQALDGLASILPEPGEGVPQEVGVDVLILRVRVLEPGQPSGFAYDVVDGYQGEFFASVGEKNRTSPAPSDQVPQVPEQVVRGWNGPLLAALALSDVDDTALEVHVPDVEVLELEAPDGGLGEGLDHAPVPELQRGVHELLDFLLGQVVLRGLVLPFRGHSLYSTLNV